MTQGAGAETNPSIWRYWAARLTLQRTLLQEQYADMQGKRVHAEKRAKAAEVIAHEANAARLQALLEAAREQATVRNIETAEQRFADARGDWEAAHRVFEPGAEDEAAAPEEMRPDAGADRAWSTRLAAALRPHTARRPSTKAIVAGAAGIAVLAVVTVYLFRDADNGAGEMADATRHRPAAPSDVAAITPAAPAPSIKPADMPVEMPPRTAFAGEDAVAPAASDVTEPETPRAAAEERAPEPAAAAKPDDAPSERLAVAPPVPSGRPAAPKPRAVPAAAPTPDRNPFRVVAPEAPKALEAPQAPAPPAPPFLANTPE